jgi:hypothetical protein
MSQTLTANEFTDFLSGQCRQIAAAFAEIEEVQKEFQGAYTRLKAEHDKTLHTLADQIEGQANGAGHILQPQIEARIPEEQQIITKQIDDLARQAALLRVKADDELAVGQKTLAELRKANPKLNEREETLKADVSQQQHALADSNTQIDQAGKGLGFLVHAGKIHTLDRERQQTLGRLQQLEEELRKVRQEWKDQSSTTAKTEMDLQQQWQQYTAQLSQVQQQHDYLAQNTSAEVQHRAIVYVIDHLKSLPAGGDAPTLQPIIDLNTQLANFQTALGSVAGVLGLLKGVDDGLKRFDESVQSVIAEQQRHSEFLPALRVELDDQVTAFGQNWTDLIAKSKDEKALATHPEEFVAAMQPFLDERLSQEHIAQFFVAMGKGLEHATARWGTNDANGSSTSRSFTRASVPSNSSTRPYSP